MIFGSGAKIRSLEARLGELETQNEALREQLASAHAARDDCLQASEASEKRSRELQRLFLSFRRIGNRWRSRNRPSLRWPSACATRRRKHSLPPALLRAAANR
jgi:chromosome segregation ATPase